MTVASNAVAADPWQPTATLVDLRRTKRSNVREFGTITRYAAVMSDDTEREVIHAQTLKRLRSPQSSVPLTIGTAPPLSLGPEGLGMHFLLKSMQLGVDAVLFGPERSRMDITDEAAMRAVASTMSFPSSAHAAHLIADRLALEASGDLSHMLWTGVSLGAIKGLTFCALAPSHNRTMVYSHFVVPAAPKPIAAPTKDELRQFMRGEFGAMMRLSAELMLHDVRDRTILVHENIARLSRPGLMWRYARSTPRDRVSRLFTEAWRTAVVTGDAGQAARRLPLDRLATFELYDLDAAGSPDDWSDIVEPLTARGTVAVVVNHGRHTDALRLSHQRDRARAIRRVVRDVQAGIPVEELEHPLAPGRS